MSNKSICAHSMVRSQVAMRNAARDGTVGAILGLFLVSGLIAADLATQQWMADSAAPLSSLAVLVGAIVLQSAIAAGLCGLMVRKFSRLD